MAENEGPASLNKTNESMRFLAVFMFVATCCLAQAEPDSDEGQAELRALQAAVEAVISRHNSELQQKHVAEIRAAYLPDKGYIIAVWIDKEENLDDVEHHEPSVLEGYPVVVFPPLDAHFE